jgi:hypothetical protein
MKNNLINIIQEEINNFNFLNNDNFEKEQENINLLKNEDFQKQFICDTLLNKIDKLKIVEITDSRIGGNWEDNYGQASILSIEYDIKIQFKYDMQKDPITFELVFDGDISINKSSSEDQGTYETSSSGEAWFNGFDWNDVNVSIFTEDGDKIDFTAFKRAPNKIKSLFVREYIESYVESYTGMEIRTAETKDNVRNVPYC